MDGELLTGDRFASNSGREGYRIEPIAKNENQARAVVAQEGGLHYGPDRLGFANARKPRSIC
jgi:hypothetical protein